jgi:hypothetical protein
MKAQNYRNHLRFYIPHHVVFYGLSILGMICCIWQACRDTPLRLIWAFMAFLVFMITFLAFMLRQHYALMNQDRTVRLEMRFRYYALTGQRLELLEDRLSFKQIAALRFASDTELAPLVARTLAENLEPAAIKQAIRDWQADHMRV